MPLSPQEIKHRQQIQNASDERLYVSPHHGDGRWANTPGTQRFTTEWEPMHDKILVALDVDTPPVGSLIVRPEIAVRDSTTRIGTVLKVGPGKWKAGERWYERVVMPWSGIEVDEMMWVWYEPERIPMTVKPGDRVAIGRYTDFESADAGYGQNIVIAMEADVRVILQ